MSEEPTPVIRDESLPVDLYDKLKSRPRHFQFSLRRLLMSMGCFAVAFSGGAWFVPALNATDSGSSEAMEKALPALFIAWPMLTLGLGAGIGILCNRLVWALVVAAAFMCSLYVAFFGAIGLR